MKGEGEIVGGRYRVRRCLGVGGMGAVYLARAEGPAGFQKDVAVKVLHDHLIRDNASRQSFLSEARLSALLAHPNIARIHDLGESDGSYFMAMEYVAGRDLRAVMCQAAERDETLPLEHVCYVIAQLCEGLNYAHALKDDEGRPFKLVHRDVTPANILISALGEVKLIDFGIAKVQTSKGLTRPGVIKGKVSYMSPEQVEGRALDRRSDIFSIGCVLYELLLGPRPFDGPTELVTMRNIVSGEHALPREVYPELPEALERIIERCLAREPADRYQYASEIHDALIGWLREKGYYLTPRDLIALLRDLFGEELDGGAASAEPVERTDETGELPPIVAATSPATERVPDLDVAMARMFARSAPIEPRLSGPLLPIQAPPPPVGRGEGSGGRLPSAPPQGEGTGSGGKAPQREGTRSGGKLPTGVIATAPSADGTRSGGKLPTGVIPSSPANEGTRSGGKAPATAGLLVTPPKAKDPADRPTLSVGDPTQGPALPSPALLRAALREDSSPALAKDLPPPSMPAAAPVAAAPVAAAAGPGGSSPADKRSTSFRKLNPQIAAQLRAERRARQSLKYDDVVSAARQAREEMDRSLRARRARKTRLLAAVALFSLVAILAFGALLWRRQLSSSPRPPPAPTAASPKRAQ